MMSVIFAECVHNPELYLVLAGKFKGTFDLFIMISQFTPIHVDDLKFYISYIEIHLVESIEVCMEVIYF